MKTCYSFSISRYSHNILSYCIETVVYFIRSARKMTTLKNKVGLVTGASSGIGAAIAKMLLKEGMKVVGVARRVEKVEELGKGYEGKLFAIKADVTSEKDIERVFSWTQKNVGPIEVLVNNAGVSYLKPIAEAESENFKNVLDTNLLAVTLFTKEAIKAMKANNINGSIVNINSVAGHYVLANCPELAIYYASKFGVTAFTESVRLDLAKTGCKIRIASLSPGLVESDMSSATFGGNIASLKPSDIANALRFIITQPPEVQIAELTIRPTAEAL